MNYGKTARPCPNTALHLDAANSAAPVSFDVMRVETACSGDAGGLKSAHADLPGCV